MWSITKKNHCTLVTFTTAVLGLSDSLPQIFIVKTFFSLNLAPGFFHISKKEDFTVIWTLLTCLAFIGICKNAVTDVKKVMDVTNCRILFAVVGSSGYLLNSTALWNYLNKRKNSNKHLKSKFVKMLSSLNLIAEFKAKSFWESQYSEYPKYKIKYLLKGQIF